MNRRAFGMERVSFFRKNLTGAAYRYLIGLFLLFGLWALLTPPMFFGFYAFVILILLGIQLYKNEKEIWMKTRKFYFIVFLIWQLHQSLLLPVIALLNLPLALVAVLVGAGIVGLWSYFLYYWMAYELSQRSTAMVLFLVLYYVLLTTFGTIQGLTYLNP